MAGSLQFGRDMPEVSDREQVRGTMSEESRESLEAVRLEKLRKIEALGLDPWGQRFDGHQAIADVRALAACPKPEGAAARPPGPKVRVAGRIMLRRGQGKVNFLQLRDWTERIQVFIGKNQVGEAGWNLAGRARPGRPDRRRRHARLHPDRRADRLRQSLTFLAKSLLPPPEKWHGLTDVEQRYRQRYVDLFSNPESLADVPGPVEGHRRVPHDDGASRGSSRSRRPTMQSIAGGAAARPFVTHHNTLDLDLFLRIAPELYLKRLLVGGMERVFEIGRVYRNEGISPRHNPEFTMMEAYQAYGDYHSMMDLTEALIVRRDRGARRRLSPRTLRATADRSTSPPPGRGGPTPSSSASTRASTMTDRDGRAGQGRGRWGSRRPGRTPTSWSARSSRRSSRTASTARSSSSTTRPRSAR